MNSPPTNEDLVLIINKEEEEIWAHPLTQVGTESFTSSYKT